MVAGDAGARFGVAPAGEGAGEGGYAEWLHAMRLVARLPAGVPHHFRKKVWNLVGFSYLHHNVFPAHTYITILLVHGNRGRGCYSIQAGDVQPLLLFTKKKHYVRKFTRKSRLFIMFSPITMYFCFHLNQMWLYQRSAEKRHAEPTDTLFEIHITVFL